MDSFSASVRRDGRRRKLKCRGARAGRGVLAPEDEDALEAWERVRDEEEDWWNFLTRSKARRRDAGE